MQCVCEKYMLNRNIHSKWTWWHWLYLFSSFRILRNFSALVSTVLVFSCSLAASCSFNLSDFFKAVHWQGKIGTNFRKWIKHACVQASSTKISPKCRYHTPGVRMLSKDKMRENILYLAMIVRCSYRRTRNRIQTKGGGVLFPNGACVSTQCNQG